MLSCSISCPSVFCICVFESSWKLRKSAPAEAPLSHRKLCSWNTSSVVRPYILWLYDITQRHMTSHSLHNLRKNWFSTGGLLLLVMLAQACVSWPIRADWLTGRIFRSRGLKETGAKTERFRRRGNTEFHWTVWENWCVFWAPKPGNLF